MQNLTLVLFSRLFSMSSIACGCGHCSGFLSVVIVIVLLAVVL